MSENELSAPIYSDYETVDILRFLSPFQAPTNGNAETNAAKDDQTLAPLLEKISNCIYYNCDAGNVSVNPYKDLFLLHINIRLLQIKLRSPL